MTESHVPTGTTTGSTTGTTTGTTTGVTGGATGSSGSGTRSLGEIVGDITQDMSTLVRQEMDVATSELKREVSRLGKGVGMFGGAGAAGYLALIFLGLAATYLLDNWMPVELAALIVALVWGAVAAVLALRGKKEVDEANPDLPVTQQTLKEDAAWARSQKS